MKLNFLTSLFLLLSSIIILNLFRIQVLNNNFYLEQAKGQYEFQKSLQAERGEIFARDRFGNFYPIAVNKNWPLLYSVPKEIKDPEKLAEKISSGLSLDFSEILKKFQKYPDPYEIIKRKVNENIINEMIQEKGIYSSYELGRFYPEKNIFSHLVGFTSYKDNELLEGQYGLEKSYQKELAGEPGFINEERGASGVKILFGKRKIHYPKNGSDLVLTIDINIQKKVAEILDKTVEGYQAAGGTAIIMNPRTGEIISLYNVKSFDPNEYNKVSDFDIFLNSAVSKLYEPGSVFKVITLAAALDKNLVKPTDTYTDYGKAKVADRIIENFRGLSYGLATMSKILEKSINTGAVFLVQKLGANNFLEYINKFGIGQKSGVDLPNEIAVLPKNLKNNKVNLATASFGQGIAVTPIEMIRAIGAIANKGRLVHPYVVSKKITENNFSQIISDTTVTQITQMMISTVENSPILKKAKVDGYSLAAKTGTAQVSLPGGLGYGDKFVHNLIAFFPAWDPQFIILLKIDNPQGVEIAAASLNEAAHNLINYIVNYYEIQPDEPNE